MAKYYGSDKGSNEITEMLIFIASLNQIAMEISYSLRTFDITQREIFIG